MNAGPDVERLIAGWLEEEAPGRAPDRILEAAGRSIDRTKQRRFIAAWRPSTMYDRLAIAGASAVLAIGVIALGATLTRTSESAAVPCPATIAEADAVDTFGPGLSRAQREWGIQGGIPGPLGSGPIAAFAYGAEYAPLSLLTIDPATGAGCQVVRFGANYQVQTALDWSPSGDALAIAFSNPDMPYDNQVLIWTPSRLLRVWSGDLTPDVEWAPDGRSIAIWTATSDGSRPPATRIIFADGSPDRTFDVHPVVYWTPALQWSPDGSRWLVEEADHLSQDTPHALSLVDLADGRVTPIDLPTGRYRLIGWLDDERVLVLDWTDGVETQRYLDVSVAAPGSFSVVPIPQAVTSWSSLLSPDREHVASVVEGGGEAPAGGDLAITGLAATEVAAPVHVAPRQRAFGVAWSPDGSQVLFQTAEPTASEGELTRRIWIAGADGDADPRQIAAGDLVTLDDPWQPVPVR
jgi:hypothetical protein